jgi:hypothetical protein
MSHRAIARLLAVSHDSVDRWAKEVADSADGNAETTQLPRWTTADDAARRLVGLLGRLDEARGLLDYLAPGRMGTHLGDALADRFGDRALDRARLFARWASAAVQTLESRS